MKKNVRDAASPADGEPVPAGGTPADELAPEVEAMPVDGGTPAGAEGVDFKDRWLRCEADLQNFRRRAARDREESVMRAQDAVLLDVIVTLDDLERALASLAGEQAAATWAQGVALTAQRLRDTLARWDVFEIEAVGRPFDPMVHEAMLEVPAAPGVAPGAVAQVVMKGYRRGVRALRAARVVVSAGGQD
jgi:molecular chaperone GrpE